MNFNLRPLLPLTITATVIVIDRLTKQLVINLMDYGQSVPFAGDVVRWTYIHNYGMAFGMSVTGGGLLGYVSIIAVVVILYILLRSAPGGRGTRWILAVILGGAIGNTYDRLVYGYVVDFIDVDLPDVLMERWPVFNIADAAVSVGVLLLVILSFVRKREQHAAGGLPPASVEEKYPTGGGRYRDGGHELVSGERADEQFGERR
ncbi:MAG: Lipoprotein signal peptidase [Calditrichaeota bacterium]|nr:Lipoprotein signal peptidase [Calditrichota bacterium]